METKDILIRKTKYSDKSVKCMIAIKNKGEIRITSKQFNEFKKLNCFQIAETDFSKNNNPVS